MKQVTVKKVTVNVPMLIIKSYLTAKSIYPDVVYVYKGNVIHIIDKDEFVVKRVNQYGFHLINSRKNTRFYVSEKEIGKIFRLKYKTRSICTSAI